jgi:hypothetical protein
MDNFFGNVVKARIPTILLLGIMYYAGIYLIDQTDDLLSSEGTTGVIILCAAGILSVVAFLDYRHKEATDTAINQMEVVVSSLSKALKASTNASAASEKVRQLSLKHDMEEAEAD